MSRLTELVRAAYQSVAEHPESLWQHLDEGAVFHVSGEHPLSGDYVGGAEIRRYLAAVREATGGRGGFSVTSAFADDSGEVVMVEGTAFHGEGPFVRTVVHRLRLSDGKLVEFRDHPFDQQTEDRFWSARVPPRREGDDAVAEEAGRAVEAGPPPVIPTQQTTRAVKQ